MQGVHRSTYARYFDTVNHDKLMRILSEKIKDGRVLSLIRKYLKSGVMIYGVIMDTEEGTPQGGNSHYSGT